MSKLQGDVLIFLLLSSCYEPIYLVFFIGLYISQVHFIFPITMKSRKESFIAECS